MSARAKWSRFLDASQSLCALCVLGMAFAVGYEIVARGLFDAPTIWSQEVSVYLLIAIGFLGLAPTLGTDEHIRIDLLTRRMAAPVQKTLRIVSLMMIAVYAATAAYGGVEMVRQSLRFGRRAPTLLAVPVWIPQMLIPIGMGLLALAAIVGAWSLFSGGHRSSSHD